MLYNSNKHKNYDILNLIGYGLSKFNDHFINEFGYKTKDSFYDFIVRLGVADTKSTVKNRMDLFDPFFPENGRRGWWQKGNAYIHRKQLIDQLFGNETATSFANIVKLYLNDRMNKETVELEVSPIVKSRFKQLQKTGLEAELYFLNNFNSIGLFKNGSLEDARLYGDGYDFQITVSNAVYLTEIKGIREKKGKFRLTENEYEKAIEYKDKYVLIIVLNLNDTPTFKTIENPFENLSFDKREILQKFRFEYVIKGMIC